MKPSSDLWFDAQDMGSGITRIRESCMNPDVACNIWHIKGDNKDLLFDSGSGIVSLKKKLPEFFQRKVICLSSHTHFDHAGGSYEFADRRVHPAEAEIITRPDRENTTIEGCMEDSLFAAYPFDGFDPDEYRVRPAPPTDLVRDGDIIDLGGRRLEVLHLPGHSPGTIGLYERKTKILFSGDAVYDGHLYDDVYHSCITDYQATMRRLLLLPVVRGFGGHHGSFDGDRMKALIHSYLQSRPGKGE